MKMLLVDDHPLFREGVASVLRTLPGPPLLLQAADGEMALQIAQADEQADLDLVIVDLRMAGTGGLVVVEQLQRSRPDLPVIVLSSSEEPEDVRRALAAGARGYCPKSGSQGALLAALHVVLAGEIYVPPFMALAGAASVQRADSEALTPRQNEVLQQLCRGHSNKQIARELGMQEKTVKGHVSAIFKALNVVHRLQAVEAARRAGLFG